MTKPSTKKSKIIKMFNSKEFQNGWKCFTKEDFYNFDLSGTVEYGEKYSDVEYAKRVIKKMGYAVTVGVVLHVNEKV